MKNPGNAILLCLLVASVAAAQAQVTPSPQPTTQDVDVIRVSTELVQTDVMVFDKSGHYVEGLEREQFQLLVDGKPQPLSLFDRVVSGSQKDAPASTGKNAGAAAAGAASNAIRRGRTVVFFIDDLHLSASSVLKTRQAILQFIEQEMSDDDQVAVASATGQIGFLQQFTDNKSVLRAAVARLNYRPYTIQDSGATMTMTEYQAMRVDQGDRDTIDYYANQMLKETSVKIPGAGGLGPPAGGPAGQRPVPNPNSNLGGMSKESADRMIKERANVLLRQAGSVTNNTLLGLESLMRSSAQLPGRKLIFLVSDGFFLNDRNTGFGEKLKQITDAALRAGAVIYSLDARGMVSMTDASTNRPDPEGHLSRSNQGELAASQDALFALAEDTGGRALLNSDALNGALHRALSETSNYYLLAWRPSAEEQKTKNYRRIEVSVIGRPELVVKLPKGYLQAQADAEMARADGSGNHVRNSSQAVPAGAKDQPGKPVESGISLAAPAPRHGLPMKVSVTFLDTPNNGPIITASVQAATAGLDYGAEQKEAAVIDLAGVVLNDQGKEAAKFKTRLNVTHLDQQQDGGVVYTYKTPLAPGLYQLRAGARDQKSGKLGTASQWIEIPDLSNHRLTLSSLLLGAQVVDVKPKSDATKPEATAPQVVFSVDRRFKKSSELSFWIFIYNATRGANGASTPDVTAQIEVVGNGKTVVKTEPRKLGAASMDDLQRISYGGKFPLATLPAGRYMMNVTITDQIAKSTASQRLSFEVE